MLNEQIKKQNTVRQVGAGIMTFLMTLTPAQALKFGVKAAVLGKTAKVLVSCDNSTTKENGNPDDPIVIQREFPITIGGKTITIKDMRTGANDQTLQAMGVVDTIKDGLESVKGNPSFNEVIERPGFVIEVKDTDDYDYYKAYSATKLGLNLAFLENPGEHLGLAFDMAINSMKDGPYPTHVKTKSKDNVRMAKGSVDTNAIIAQVKQLQKVNPLDIARERSARIYGG